MAYSGSTISIGDARLLGVADLLVANLSSLNTALARDSVTSPLVSSPYSTLTAAYDGAKGVYTGCVQLGDTVLIWDPKVYGTVRFCVCAGGGQSGIDFTSDYEFIDHTAGEVTGRRLEMNTALYAYIHPDVYRNEDPILQTQYRERARERITDWMRDGIFNTGDHITLQLTSSTFYPAPTYDQITRCRISMGQKGYFVKGMEGNMAVYGVHLMHTSLIA